jgi:glycosyltransferase involved in cell wall biosynthesis
MKTPIYIIGAFGYTTGHLDGQTMESRSLRTLLEMHGILDYTYFDTEQLHFNKSSFLKMFGGLFKTERLFYLGAQANLKYIFPFLWIIAKLRGIEFHYFVVGGWIAEFLKDKPLHRWMLRRINGMYTETWSIANKLTKFYGYKHVDCFPNFRIYNFEPDIKLYEGDPLRLVYMARIVASKGYMRVLDLARYLKDKYGEDKVVIDFFGPIFPDDKDIFINGVKEFSFVSYKGVLQPEVINETLANYDAMLFPTNYPGEGLPGTIVDSYISGIPVIASDWRYNAELIDHGKTGFIFDLNNINEFYESVELIMKDRHLLYNLKLQAHAKRIDFDYKTAWNVIEKHAGIQPVKVVANQS